MQISWQHCATSSLTHRPLPEHEDKKNMLTKDNSATTRRPTCCSGDIMLINIGGSLTGIVGLRGIFRELHTLGRPPEPAVADELLVMVKATNYVPPKWEDAYKEALLREYTTYCARRPR